MAAEAEAWRKEHSLTVVGKEVPAPFQKFSDCTMFPDTILKSFKVQKFERPTVIQAQAWPILLQQRDMIGIAKTGSGKTLAFIIPAILHIQEQRPLKPGKHGPICLVLAPTRELAQQIEQESQRVLPEGMYCTVVYGGMSKGPQIQALEQGVHICVATPGRLIDLLDSGKTNLNRVTFLVLDEADRMLDLGFEPAVRQICQQLTPERQTVMFSATWPESVQELAKNFQRDAVQIHVGSMELLANPDVTQHFVFVKHDGEKMMHLRKLLQKYQGKRILIFALYKKSVDYLEGQLRSNGVIAIHSDKTQQHRESMLDRFRKTQGCLLVATDVAARGLDVKELEVVINYEFPLTSDDYVHRIGRTGRAGAKGEAYTLLSDNDGYFDGFAARDVERILQNVGQPVPKEVAAKAEPFRFRTKPKKEKIPEAPAYVASAPSKSMKFADSDDDDDALPAKKKA